MNWDREAELHVRRSARPRYAMSRSASVSMTRHGIATVD
jgi:hypothetical protein